MKKLLTFLTILMILPIVYGSAMCVLRGGISIVSPNEFGVNEELNIKVVLNLASGDNAGKSVTLYLIDKTRTTEDNCDSCPTNYICLNNKCSYIEQQKSLFTNTDGEAEFTKENDNNHFEGIPRSGTFTLYATNEDLSYTKTITIKPKIDLRMNVPTTNFVGFSIKIDLRITDAETGTVLNADKLIASVFRGVERLSYSISGTTITIPKDQVTTIGTITVEATAEKSGYITDTETATITVQDTTTEIDFKIDNKDEIDFSTEGIKTGNRKIRITAKEGNEIIKIGDFNIEIMNPSGETQKLTFFKKADGSYETSYNFLEAGNVYYISGTIQIFGEGREPIPIDYTVTTIEVDIPVLPFELSWWVIAGIIAFIVLLIVLFFVFRRKKPRAPRPVPVQRF